MGLPMTSQTTQTTSTTQGETMTTRTRRQAAHSYNYDSDEVAGMSVEDALEYLDMEGVVNQDYDALTALQKAMGFGDLDELLSYHEDNYHGEWSNHEEFLTALLEDTGSLDYESIQYLVIDWQASWDRNYRHDFVEQWGHYWYSS